MNQLQQGDDAYLQGNHKEALDHYRAAHDAGEHPADAFFGCGAACDLLGMHDEALTYFDLAVSTDNQHVFAHHYRGTQLLLRGQFHEGWDEYRWYYQSTDFEKIRPTLPLWDGMQCGQRILLLSDQGLGDALQFLRYCPRLHEFFPEVLFEGSTQLFRVVDGNVKTIGKVPLQGIRELFPSGYAVSGCDYYAPLSSLPRMFNSFHQSAVPQPAAIPLSPRLRDATGKQYCHKGKFKVAIAWRGSKRTLRWTVRDIPPEMFGLLNHISGIQFYSMDMNPTDDELDRLQLGALTTLREPMNHLRWDLVDTASVLANMNLVITCDSAIAHLAGSLQTPVWIALPYASEWRWRLNRLDSEWYPHARLYRQPGYGRWEPVFEEIARDLAVQARM